LIQRQKNNSAKEKPLLLVAPLDWGLGHTTRMIPVIQHLLYQGCEVIVACNSTQKALLENEFPTVRFVYLEGYNIRYGYNRTGTMAKQLLHLPNILTKVKSEEMWFLRFLAENKVDAVISDNRYGIRNSQIPSVLVTHQLNIRSGFGKLADYFIRRLLYRRINSFTACWVPDFAGTQNLAGALSHPKILPAIPVQYIGCLSRLEPCVQETKNPSGILIILSGPEPQRTILENRILEELRTTNYQDIVLLRGMPGNSTPLPAISGVRIFDHADAKKLNELMCASGLVISRSGYTTVMDAVKLKKKLVVVSTPGQPEQEYLARHLSANNIAAAMIQQDFSLAGAISLSSSFNYRFPTSDMEQYKNVIVDFIASRFSS
jgi:UDP-N-acetylglucosamine transferase subunit ALG13